MLLSLRLALACCMQGHVAFLHSIGITIEHASDSGVRLVHHSQSADEDSEGIRFIQELILLTRNAQQDNKRGIVHVSVEDSSGSIMLEFQVSFPHDTHERKEEEEEEET